MINGLHHIALSTLDIERLTRFYTEVLGFEVVDWQGGWEQGNALVDSIVGLQDSSARQVMLRVGNLYLEVFQYLSPQPAPRHGVRRVCDPGYTHFCLNVTDIVHEYQRLKAAGMVFHHEPVFDHASAMAATYGRDPDGNVIEIQEIFKPDHVFDLSKSGLANRDL